MRRAGPLGALGAFLLTAATPLLAVDEPEYRVVERDEPIFEISTDKVDTEIPSPAAGVLKEVLVEEGDTVRNGEVLAVLEDDEQKIEFDRDRDREIEDRTGAGHAPR